MNPCLITNRPHNHFPLAVSAPPLQHNHARYDLAGHEVVQYGPTCSPCRDEIYAGGRHLATYNNSTTYFIHPDWLGTERARSNVSGTLCETITSLPFGDGQSTSGSCSDASPMHFTGKPRDTESNLDYFGARYYGSSLGRFASPDWSEKPANVPFADFADPQSLNLYSYVRNTPSTRSDANGHCIPNCTTEIVSWFIKGTVRDGSPKEFAKNVGIGTAKGAGTFAYNTAKAVDTAFSSMGNPAAGVAAALKPGPAALQPSNLTQAQASAVTQVVLTTASALAPGMTSGSATSAAGRGMNELGGIMSSQTNAAGGTLVTASGAINQSDVAGAVNSALYSGGDINILSGVHGLEDGTMVPEASFFQSDQAAFGDLPGVTVYDLPLLSDSQIANLVNGQGTTIGAFCNSGSCLAPLVATQ